MTPTFATPRWPLSPGMKNLRHLTLIGTLVTDDSLKYLRDLTKLEELDLYGVKITDDGVEHLRKLTALRKLNLLGAQITDSSADILAQFRELRELNLYRSRITNAGLDKLRQLPHLQVLDLRYSAVTNAGVDALRTALPKCRISFVNTAPSSAGQRAESKPADNSEASVARWIQSMGGEARVAGRPHPVDFARPTSLQRCANEIPGAFDGS